MRKGWEWGREGERDRERERERERGKQEKEREMGMRGLHWVDTQVIIIIGLYASTNLSMYSFVRYLLHLAQEKQNRCQCLLRAIRLWALRIDSWHWAHSKKNNNTVRPTCIQSIMYCTIKTTEYNVLSIVNSQL